MLAGFGGERPRGEWRLLAEQRWEFDLSGVVHLPKLLDRDEVAAVTGPNSAAAWELAKHPRLETKLKQLFGDEYPNYDHAAVSSPVSYSLDRPPRLLEPSDPPMPLADCLDPRERLRLRYDDFRARPDVSAALGLRVLFALGETSEVAVVPCSHKTSPAYAPPATLAEIKALQATVLQPKLGAGDVLLLAAPTVVAIDRSGDNRTCSSTPHVIELLLVDHALSAPGMGYVPRPIEELPSWFAEMTPAQQAVLGPREGRPGSGVATDGSDVWVEPDPASLSFAWAAGAATAALQQNKNPLMVAHEVWQWETQGYLIIRGVMDPEWIKGCNHALDTFRDDPNVVHKIGASELWQETDCSTLLLPTERDADGEPILEERMTGLEALPKPHCDWFRKMVAHPAVVARLNWMMGPGWSESPASASVNRHGAGGQQMHGGPRYGGFEASNFSATNLGHLNATQVNYHWVLRDVSPGDGGFTILPGSCKMRHHMPRPPTTSIELSAVQQLVPKAGDIVFYHGSHGVLGWRGVEERRQVLKSSHHVQHPSDFRRPFVQPMLPSRL